MKEEDLMTETPENPYTNEMDSLAKKFRWILGLSIFAVIILVVFSHCSYHNTTREILDNQNRSNSLFFDSLKSLQLDTTHLVYQIDERVLQQIESNQAFIQKELEMQFERQQSERNVLEIWGAVITIVFLVFSFYSSFRIDDMLKKAHSTLSQLTNLHSKAETESATIEGKLAGLLEPYQKQAADIQGEIKSIEEKIGKIQEVPDKINKIDTFDSFIKETNKKLAEDNSALEQMQRELQALKDDVSELSFDDQVGDEPKLKE